MTRTPLRPAEEYNLYGAGALNDAEVAEFTATVDYLRSVIPAAFGMEWNDPVVSGDGYVVTEVPRSSGRRYFDGYQGLRKTANGYVAMTASERNSGSGAVTFSRFGDAVKGYAAGVIDSFRMQLSGRYLGYVAWMWNGTTGPGVVAQPLNPSNTQFRDSLENDPSIWLDNSFRRSICGTDSSGHSSVWSGRMRPLETAVAAALARSVTLSLR